MKQAVPFGSLLTATIAMFASVSATSAAVTNPGTNFWRFGDANGLGGVLSNMVFSNVDRDDVYRPNGQADWVQLGGTGMNAQYRVTHGPSAWNGSVVGTPYTDVAAAAAWSESNTKGLWNYGSFTVDTTSAFVSQLDMVFPELTAASANLFTSIRDGGLTGTFTFNLKQAAVSGQSWFLGGPTGGPGSQYGVLGAGATSFDVTITTAMSAGFWMQLGYSRGVAGVLSQSSGVAYGALAVPAPGALTVVALCGLGAARRRR